MRRGFISRTDRGDIDELRDENQARAVELAYLRGLANEPRLARLRGYARLLGPGYMQSAMTLGGGTASSALFAGATFGYSLLWVAPVAMAMGICMLAAVSYQALTSEERPWRAMHTHAGAAFAWAWAIGALLSSIIWQFPQYALSSAVLVDLADMAGWQDVPRLAAGAAVLVWAVGVSTLYGRSRRGVRLYENALQITVWTIVLCFGWVVLQTGVRDWGALFAGFFAFQVPGETQGIAGVTLILSGLSAAVGVNMVFLYPYSLRTRGWGREHRELARVDLGVAMFLPYALAVSLVIIATANTIHLDPRYAGTRLSPVAASAVLAEGIGPFAGRLVFNLGILAMALSSITLQMLTCGFVAAEIFGWEVSDRRYRLATLLPVPGVLGAAYWSDIAVWVAVPTNIVCGLFLPLAYVGFLVLQRSRAYLGDQVPSGPVGNAWWLAMLGITIFMGSFLGWYALENAPKFFAAFTAGAG